MKTDTIAQTSFENGQKLSEYGFIQAGGLRYNYRMYVVAFNKLMKAKDAETYNSNPLVQTLKEQTETLRVQYLEKVEGWARGSFARFEKEAVLPSPRYADYVNPEITDPQERIRTNKQDHAGQKRYHRAVDARYAAIRIVEAGLEAYLAREAKMAEQHYQDSVLKLAARIVKKGLDQNNLTIKTAHIGINIETVFTDGNKIVKAWTIIAEGPIQRPHYRYLVK